MVALLGIPDMVGCLNGYFVGLELKRKGGGRTSELQKWCLHRIRMAGGIGLVVDPENFEVTYNFLKHLSQAKPFNHSDVPDAGREKY